MLIKAIKETFISKQFLRFLASGAVAALVNFFSRFAFQMVFPFTWSVALAFSLGTLVSFILNRTFTFAAYDEKAVVQFMKFIIIALAGIVFAAAIASLCMALYRLSRITIISHDQAETASHLITIFLITFFNFLAMKFFSFKRF